MSDPAVAPAGTLAVAAGTTAADAVAAAGLPTSGPKAVVVVRDPEGQLHDLAWAPAAGATANGMPVRPAKKCWYRRCSGVITSTTATM